MPFYQMMPVPNMNETSYRYRETLTHLGRVTHICVIKLTIIVSDNGLSPCRRQAIIWTSGRILLIRTLGTNFSEILIAIHTFSFKNIDLKISSGKWRPSCLVLNVLMRTTRWKCASLIAISHQPQSSLLGTSNKMTAISQMAFWI